MSNIIKDISSGNSAKESLIEGVNIVADVVGSTIGYRGRTVLIETDGNKNYPTKDGYDALQAIHLENPLHNLACELLKEASTKTVEMAGDGPQPLYAKILTPYGWTTMGELKVGDKICGTNGTKQTVLGVFPKGEKEILKFKFSDGRVVECCEDHLWNVFNDRKQKVITAKEIINKGLFRRKTNNERQFQNFIPVTYVDFEKNNNLPLDSYLLGLLIGDGSLTGTGSIELSIGYAKKHVLDKIILPEGVSFNVKNYENKNYLRVKFVGCDINGKYLKDILKDLGLLGTNSSTKFIPKDYLFSDLESRKSLLQGIIDTDGYINNRGFFEISTIGEQLFNDYVELCRGLGYQLNTTKLIRKKDSSYSNTPIYRITQLKGYKDGIKLVEIEKTGLKTEMKCIKVSNEDSLYITDDYVVTHNTSATIVLAQAFVKYSYQEFLKGKSPIDIKNDIEKSRDKILKYLEEIAIPVTDELIYNVAKTSANSDEEIAKIVTDAFLSAGENGSVAHFRSDTDETYLERIEGTLVENGYTDELFVNVAADRTVVFDNNPLMIFSEITFKTVNQIKPFLAFAVENDREIVLFSDMEYQVENVLLNNKQKGAIKIAVVKPPSFGQKRKDVLKDLAMICGTQAITTLSGDNFEGKVGEFLGECKKIVIGKTDTIITPKDDSEISEKVLGKINELKEVIKNTSNSLEKKYCNDRIAKLSGGVSIIKVGGVTDSELLERLARVDDAVKAVYSAKEEGVLAGGGVALFNAANLDLDFVSNLAIVAPLNKILENASIKHDISLKGYPFGYDVKNFQEVDMYKAGIVDCHKVVKNSLVNAISVANTILLTNNIITLKREKYEL